ncbi:MAG: hypothetical protein JWN93_2500 [Hyphomicrobiales bacterium]|jgi:uncharacterized membrane protein YfcA|nr:hypothetical protein [Hyphomicrobiales bacterium]
MISDANFYALAIPAVVFLGLGKGGFSGVGLLAFPMLSLVVPPFQAAAIILPLLMVQDIVGVWAFRREYSLANLKLLAPGGLIGLGVGWALARHVSNGVILVLVGFISAAFVVYQVAGKGLGARAATGPAAGPATFWGTICGFTSFVANAGAPPFQVYMLPQKLPPRVYAGTSQIFFAVVNYLKFPAFLQLGQMNATTLTTSAALLPLAVASVSVGIWLVRRMPAERFYKVIYALTFVVGLKLTWDGLRQLGVF